MSTVSPFKNLYQSLVFSLLIYADSVSTLIFFTILQINICCIIWMKWKLFSSPVHIGKEACKYRILLKSHLNKPFSALPVATRIGCLESRSSFSGWYMDRSGLDLLRKHQPPDLGSLSPEQRPACSLA